MLQPPKSWLKFLRWYCKTEFIEEIEGDLIELFEKRALQSPTSAKRKFMWDVVKSIRWVNLKKHKIKNTTMYALANYLKIYFRRFRRGVLHYSVNVLGLVLGFTVLTYVLLYSNDELTIDGYHQKADRIYRVIEKSETQDGVKYYSSVANPLAAALKADFPEVVETANMFYFGSATHIYKENRIANRNYAIVTNGIFNIWDTEVINGNPLKEFQGPAAVVLTSEFAKRLFGEENPVGKVVESKMGNCEVLAVIEDLPKNATFQFDIFYVTDLSRWNQRFQGFLTSWDTHFMNVWVLFREGTGPEDIQPKLDQFLSKYLDESLSKEHQLSFQNIQDIHLKSGHLDSAGGDLIQAIPYSDMDFIQIILIIGASVIIIAALNYINLSSVQALKRSIEAGIRKVNGATTGQLKVQLYLETLFTLIISGVITTTLVILLLPYFNLLTGKSLIIYDLINLNLFNYILVAFITIWLISGLLPALYYGKLDRGLMMTKNVFAGKGDSLRKGFIFLQYAISMILIIGVIVLYNQLEYIQNKNLGFNNSNLITLDINSRKARVGFQGIKNGILSHPAVENVTVTSRLPGEWKQLPIASIKTSAASEPVGATHYGMDKDGLETYGISLIDGKNFSGNAASDSLKVILNETAVNQLGLKNPIGQTVWIEEDTLSKFQVIGVVKDFHFESLYEPIKPAFITSWNNPILPIDYYVVRYNGDPKEVLSHIEKVNSEFDPETPPEFHFLDEQWKRYYVADQTRGTFILIAAVLSILISIIGLFGMIHYTVERRTKEVGIRKVIGASVPALIKLLVKDYVILLAMAMVVSGPIAWFFLEEWLSSFAFRISLNLWVFISAFLLVLTVSGVTVMSKIYRLAKSNPAMSLRYE